MTQWYAWLRFAGVLCCWGLVGCVSTEPTQLVPSINLSPEQVNLAPASQGPDVGWELASNESDSLENFTVLPGVRVVRVEADGPAAAAGVKAGDILLAINDITTNSPGSVQTVLGMQAGPWQLQLRRGTTVYQTRLSQPRATLTYQPEERYRADPLRTRAGYITDSLQGAERTYTVATVVALSSDSPLATAGVQEGDHIMALDGQVINSAQGLVTQLTTDYAFGQTLTLSVVKAGQKPETANPITVDLWAPPRRLTGLKLWPLFTYSASANGERTRFALLDFFVVSLFAYQRRDGEKRYQLFTLFEWATGYGELSEGGDYE